jgi:osmotically-inducible protein OsmY
MRNNEDVQKDVQSAIKWEPLLHAAEIGVTVKDGIVTLTGTVDSYTKKQEAENAAKGVHGVNAIVEKLVVNFGSHWKKDDNDIAKEILSAFKWDWQVPNDCVKVTVENSWVTLDGELTWNFQREAAKKTAGSQEGVKGIINHIKLKSETKDILEKEAVDQALARNWSIDMSAINVSVSANVVTLTGTVNSIYQKEQAERLAWNAPGVWAVNNQLEVEFEYSYMD